VTEARPATETPPPQPGTSSRLALVDGPQSAAAPAPARQRRPFEGWGSAIGRALRAVGRFVGRVSVLIFGHVRTRAERAHSDFQKRDHHFRWRTYALGSYGLLVALTLLFQVAYQPNSLRAYVRLEHLEFPKATYVFLVNESDKPWTKIRVTLNGLYSYERLKLEPGQNVQLRLDRFAQIDKSTGRMKFAPQDIVAQRLLVECEQGRYETEELKP
jgi:hypothetical protein